MTTETTPKRRFGVGALFIVAALGAALAAGLMLVFAPASRTSPRPPAQAATAPPYQCPMHPTVVQDHPGSCPICSMSLIRLSKPAPGHPTYQCPMHPSVVQVHPGNCPICGMSLVRLDKPAEAPKPVAEHPTYQCPMHPSVVQDHPGNCPSCGMRLVKIERRAEGHPSAQGLATVEIDPARQQLIGLKTAEVTHGPVGGAWRTVGRVAIDETRVRHINMKVTGFVERVYVDFVGKKVRRGDALFSVYSPDLFAAQEEYLLALRTQGALARAGGAVASDGDALVAAARRKLTLWDVPQSEIDRITKTGQPAKTLTFYSPVSGVVTRKDVVEGMKLDAGAMPYEIVDLTSVWVLADVYESELRFVSEGLAASLRLNAFPNRDFKGKVVFVDPLLDPKTRTVKVRLTFPNPTGELRPEMFGEVVLHGEPHDGLRVPPDAVIDSGTQKVVFVATGGGKFQPRLVKLGDGDAKHVEVLEGLSAGEKVVTRANFLVDSESRLRASLAELTSGAGADASKDSARVLPGASEPPPGAAHAGHGK